MHVVSFQIVPSRPWGQRSFLFHCERRWRLGLTPPAREADSSLHLVIRLRMSGALPQFPDVRLWRARVQLYVHAAMLSGFFGVSVFERRCDVTAVRMNGMQSVFHRLYVSRAHVSCLTAYSD